MTTKLLAATLLASAAPSLPSPGQEERPAVVRISCTFRQVGPVERVPRRLLAKLTLEAKQKLLQGNHERLCDEARKRVRAWEKANVK